MIAAQQETLTGSEQERPWQPKWLVLAAWAAGPLGCGVAAGINFARMGKRDSLFPCLMMGATLLLTEAFVLVFLIQHPAAFGMPTVLANVLIGYGFMRTHRGSFEHWKKTSWVPKCQGEVYRPNGIGLLTLIILLCIGIHASVMLAMMSLAVGV
jgi:hypothetical protein